MLHIKVAGGTGAGRRLTHIREPWTHRCPVANEDGARTLIEVTTRSYSCPLGCGARRP